MRIRRSVLMTGLAVLAVALALGAEEDKVPAAKSFPLDELSLVGMTAAEEAKWTEKGIDLTDFWRGYPVYGEQDPQDSVKYPDFATDDAWYGAVHIGGWKADNRISAPIAITRTAKDASSYDLIYIDTDLDGDLTDEVPSRPTKNGQETMLLPSYWRTSEQATFFATFTPVTLALPEESPIRSYSLYPLLASGTSTIDDEEKPYASLFLRRPVVRTGDIDFLGEKYTVVLGDLLTGRYDGAHTRMQLCRKNGERSGRWAEEMLGWLRYEDGQFWDFSAAPDGSQLRIAPFSGPMGRLRLSAGERDITEFEISGHMTGQRKTVPVGDLQKEQTHGSYAACQECRLPVDDYLPSWLTIRYGNLRLFVSESYHSDGKPRDMARSRRFTIPIREDQPFVFDFSHEPEVMFASPPKDAEFKPGDKVTVSPVLYVPALDMMIRNLDDTQQEVEITETHGTGTTNYKRLKSLDPTVTIRDSQGNVVAEGTAPFG